MTVRIEKVHLSKDGRIFNQDNVDVTKIVRSTSPKQRRIAELSTQLKMGTGYSSWSEIGLQVSHEPNGAWYSSSHSQLSLPTHSSGNGNNGIANYSSGVYTYTYTSTDASYKTFDSFVANVSS